ncbi:MAG TPA: hypothetical protein VGB64_06135 [Actinomycetota bacterium]
MNETDISRAMKESAAGIATDTTMPAATLRRARRGRSRTLVASLASVALIATGSVAALRTGPLPSRPPVTTATSCHDIREIGTIGRDTSAISIAAATKDGAVFTGVSPQYYTATVNARPRAGRIDAAGTISWFEFDHPEDGFQTRTAEHLVAVSDDEAWFIVDAGGRYVGESALWRVDGAAVTRPAIIGPIRSVAMERIVARGGRVWAAGTGSSGLFVARWDGERWTQLPGQIPDFQGFKTLTVDRGGTPYLQVTVTDWARMPKPATPGGAVPSILFTKDALYRHDGTGWVEIGMPDGKVSTVEGGSAGELWAAVYSPGLNVWRYAAGRWAKAVSADDQGAASVRLSSDDEGRLFIAEFITAAKGDIGESRLWVVAGDELTRVPLPDRATATMITGLAATDDGAVWFAAGATVYRATCGG